MCSFYGIECAAKHAFYPAVLAWMQLTYHLWLFEKPINFRFDFLVWHAYTQQPHQNNNDSNDNRHDWFDVHMQQTRFIEYIKRFFFSNKKKTLNLFNLPT